MQIATVMAALSLVSELGRAQNLDSVATVVKAITGGSKVPPVQEPW